MLTVGEVFLNQVNMIVIMEEIYFPITALILLTSAEEAYQLKFYLLLKQVSNNLSRLAHPQTSDLMHKS